VARTTVKKGRRPPPAKRSRTRTPVHRQPRDDFPLSVKEQLAKRVGNVCSLPECRRPTSGPHADPSKSVNIGVAAHITAAAPGGPRYDPGLTPIERRSAQNGFWVCQSHAKLVDSDESTYSLEQLRAWKADACDRARRILEGADVAAEDRRVDEERGRWLNDTTSYEFKGRTVHLAWGGPIDELKAMAPRVVDSEELCTIQCALCGYGVEHLQPRWLRVEDPAARDVWEVDERRTSRRRLRSLHLRDEFAFLKVSRRREPCNDFCPRCGRTFGSAVYCQTCGEELKKPFTVTRCP
jgi:hypothetical protein